MHPKSLLTVGWKKKVTSQMEGDWLKWPRMFTQTRYVFQSFPYSLFWVRHLEIIRECGNNKVAEKLLDYARRRFLLQQLTRITFQDYVLKTQIFTKRQCHPRSHNAAATSPWWSLITTPSPPTWARPLRTTIKINLVHVKRWGYPFCLLQYNWI